jgi:phage terminase large subunit-like protein
VEALLYDWPGFLARPTQLAPPGNWRTWLVLAGRGFGKTRTGGEWVRSKVEAGVYGRLALVAPTAADARDVMVEGESGVLSISPPWNRPKYEPSKRRLTWPNGAQATLYSADEPDRLRGPQHDGAWADEIASWSYADAWDQLQFGLRLGDDPRIVATTTPKPIHLIRDLVKSPTTVLTRGTSYQNRANLAPAFFSEIIAKYEGSRLGRQELLAELLEDTPGALWKRKQIDDLRLATVPSLKRKVIALDPPVSSGENSAECGIIVAGLDELNHGHILADLSLRGTPDEWMRAGIKAYHDWNCDKLVAEVNNGGELIQSLLRVYDKNVAYAAVRASHSKYTRAEPVAGLYEQKRVHHVGSFPALEDQMCSFLPGGESPDHMDAMVWAIWHLMLSRKEFVPEVTKPR